MLKRKSIALFLAGVMAAGLAACGTGSAGQNGTAQEGSAAQSSAAGENSAGESTAAGENDGSQSKTAQDPSSMNLKEQLDIAVAAEPAVLDLHKTSSSTPKSILCGSVYEQLFALNGDSEPEPELCESYEMNEDATEFTFKLRSGVNFHDGSVMDADDVVASLNRWIESYSGIRNLVGESRFEKVDDLTVAIKLDSSCITLPYMLAAGSQRAVITTVEAIENEGEDGYLSDTIGTGPYTMTQWVTDQYVMLERFEDYVPYGNADESSGGVAGYKHAYTDRICYWVVSEEATRVAGLSTGQYDSSYISDSMIATVESGGNVAVTQLEEGQVAIVFNKKAGLCSDVNMRKAVNAAINTDELMVVSYGSSYTSDSSYMESDQSLWFSIDGGENYNTQDMEAAAGYLADAGYNGETLRILASSDNNFDKIATVLEQQLENAGIDCELTTVDWGTFTEYRTDPEGYDLFISSYGSLPLPSLKAYFSPDGPGWTDDEQLNTLWDAYESALSLEDAAAAWEDVQAYCWDYLPIISLGHYLSNYALNTDLEGVITQTGQYFWNAYVPLD